MSAIRTPKKEKIERFELIESVDEARFKLSSPTEILQLLKRIREKRVFLSAHSPATKNSFLTAIFEIDEDRKQIVFDSPSDPILRRRFLSGHKVTLTTAIDRVRIQFNLASLHATIHDGNPAYMALFPEQIIRLQRRDYYRLTVPIVTPVRCELTVGHSHWASKCAYGVYDISLGGIGINNMPLMSAGHVIKNASITLPEGEAFTADLVVCHTFSVYLKTGQRLLRTGCRYVDESASRSQRIQRYINKITMERRARENRLDQGGLSDSSAGPIDSTRSKRPQLA